MSNLKPLTIWLEKRDIRKDIIHHIKHNLNGMWVDHSVKIKMPGASIEIKAGANIISMEKLPLKGTENKYELSLTPEDMEFVLQWSILSMFDVLRVHGYKVEGMEEFDSLLKDPEIPPKRVKITMSRKYRNLYRRLFKAKGEN